MCEVNMMNEPGYSEDFNIHVLCAYTHIHTYTHKYIYLCIYIYTYIWDQRKRETEAETKGSHPLLHCWNACAGHGRAAVKLRVRSVTHDPCSPHECQPSNHLSCLHCLTVHVLEWSWDCSIQDSNPDTPKDFIYLLHLLYSERE